jgi:hypothetical protein
MQCPHGRCWSLAAIAGPSLTARRRPGPPRPHEIYPKPTTRNARTDKLRSLAHAVRIDRGTEWLGRLLVRAH